MKNTLIVGAVVIIVLVIAFLLIKPKETTTIPVNPTNTNTQEQTEQVSETQSEEAQTEPQTTDTGRLINPDVNIPEYVGKLKAANFTGTLEKVDTGCFADGECFVEVDGKHITTIMGWSQNVVGSVIGVEGFGDLEGHIGQQVEVYAQDNSDGTYTLYGSEGFYIKLVD